MAQPSRFKKKAHLFRAGEVCRNVGFVNKGCLRHYFIDDKGNDHIAYFAFEEWWVGDLQSFYSQKPTVYNLQTLEDCEIFLFTLPDFQKAIHEIPAFNEFILIKHRKSYTATIDRFVNSKSESAEEKYLKLLQKSPEVFQRVPQHYIASYLGIKPQSLSRLRKKILRDEGRRTSDE